MTQRSDLLIDAVELHALMRHDNPPVIADCRFALADPGAGEKLYAQGHIPSAQYLHLDRDLSARRGTLGGRHPLPDAESFTAVMRRIGLRSDALLVACDDSRGAYAARLWWLARYFGHRSVCVLDGGLTAWRNQGFALDTRLPVVAAGDFEACADAAMKLDFDALCGRRNTSSLRLVDSREPRRYQGLEEQIDPKAGHIPGAINHPWTEAVDADGFFLDAAAQAARWRDIGDARAAVVYCGSGVTACVNLLSLELAGLSGAKLYPGSWSDWCARPEAQIAVGAD